MPQKQGESFGRIVAGVLEKRGLSYAEVAKVLGHKSKTTLHRILNDDCSPAMAEKFYHAFLASGLCELGEEEQIALDEALEVSLVGREQFLVNQAMWRIFRGECVSPADVPLRVSGEPPWPCETLESLLAACFQADNAHLLVINACQTPLFPLLAKMLRTHRRAKVYVDHLLFVDGDAIRTANSMNALMEILCDSRCNSCSVCCGDAPYGYGGLMRDDWAIVRLEQGGNVWEWQVALFAGGGYAIAGRERAGLFDFWREILRAHAPNVQPIRRARVIGQSEKDFFALMERLVEMEQSQSLYVAKGGVFINLVPPDILQTAFLEGHAGEASPELKRAAAYLHRIQTLRYENRRKQYQSTYYICTRAELCEFARTGLHHISFPFLRPYTMEERRRIFQSILNEMQENPYFDFRLLRNGGPQSKLQMCFLEGGSVLFIAPCHAGACEERQYVEAMFLQKEFNAQLHNFFRRELLGRQSMPREETRKLLAQLIQEMADGQ